VKALKTGENRGENTPENTPENSENVFSENTWINLPVE